MHICVVPQTYGLFPRNLLKHKLISQNPGFKVSTRYPPPGVGGVGVGDSGNKPILAGIWEIRILDLDSGK